MSARAMTLSEKPAQLPLLLPHRPAQGRADFLVAPCNEDAVVWIDRWPDWPGPALVLHGPAGSGKTHLLHVWAEAARAPVWAAHSLHVADLDQRLSDHTALAIDEAESVADPDAFFHLFNMMRDRGGTMLLAARAAPARWSFGRADMRSRMMTAPAVALGAPDDDLLGAVLHKLFADRQLPVGIEVVRYILSRMPRTFEAAGQIVETIDRLALAERWPPTLPLARRALSDFCEEGEA